MRKLSEGEIIALGMFATIITTLTLVPIIKVMMILRDLEELSNGRATSRSYSYD